MLQFIEQNRTQYDSKGRIWSGPVSKRYYDRNCSFGKIAFEELRRRPSHVCQISDSENTRLTNEEVRIQAIRIAKQFEKLGIKQKDIIGICGHNTTYLYAVTLACFFHGSAYHAISPLHDKKTLKHLFDITKPRLIFCDGQDLEKIRYASSDFKTTIFTMKSHFKGVPSVLDLLETTGDENLYQPAELENGPSQTLAILCSSGTTGMPKAVTISNITEIVETADYLTSDDVIFMIPTMDWISALLMIGLSIVHGAPRVITEKPFSPEYYLEVIEKYNVTNTVNYTSFMAAIVNCPKTSPEKLESLRYFWYGGAKPNMKTQQAVQDLLKNGRVVGTYGFTEFNNAVCRNIHLDKKPNAAGLLLSGVKARIVDENGQNLGPNEIGELLCYHGNKWAGYYNNAEATRTIYDDEGWFHSGDMAYFDSDKFLYFTERKKDLLKYKGSHYFPSEIGEVIMQLPDVKEVCVFGIDSEIYGDMAAAAVVIIEGSSLTPEDVVRHVRQEIGSDFKHLHGGCKLFDVIPKLPNGKIDRKTTKTIFLDK